MAFPPDAYRLLGDRNLAGKACNGTFLQLAWSGADENPGIVPFQCSSAFAYFLFKSTARSDHRR
jgi:hypothetical protein